MINRILFTMHIMWYESKMINETLDSIAESIVYSSIPVDIVLYLNSQTYLEKPITGNSSDMFKEFLSHPLIKECNIFYKTDDDPFYNIGDFRRDLYNPSYKYTVWGESDCLLPINYFYILSNVNIDELHILSFASRKMWDYTWSEVEHTAFKSYEYVDSNKPLEHLEYVPYRYFDVISQNELNSFNETEFNINIYRLNNIKVDGSLLALSNNLPHPFIHKNLHFVREDTYAALFFTIKNISQYHVSNVLKGHNYNHPLKRCNTVATRSDDAFKQYEQISYELINKLWNEQ